MNDFDEAAVKKVGMFYRACCGFICLCCIFVLFTAFAFWIAESAIAALGVALFSVALSYLCGSVAFTGYPPKFLMWAQRQYDD